jgi:hypothetical protein
MGKKKKDRERGTHRPQGAANEAPLAQPVSHAAPEPVPDASAMAAGAAAPPASPLRRKLENAFIACFLAFMLAMPLRYYMGGRGFDERFSWRMFSTIRMLECKAKVVETLEGGGERKVDLGREVQVAWVGLLERGRELVIAKLLARRCAEPDVREVRYGLRCESPDGTRMPELKRALRCADKGAP